MTAKLVIDIYYAAFTDAEGPRQDITVRLRQETDTWSQNGNIATLSRRLVGDEYIYKTGFQSISSPEKPELLIFEAYFRAGAEERFEMLMKRVESSFSGNLNSGTTWMESWGLRISNGIPAGDIIDDLRPTAVAIEQPEEE